jgi:hypothetical protein
MSAFTVDDVLVGSRDSSGVEVKTVYSKISTRYAVYRTAERVVVQYADDDSKGVEQRVALAALNCPKGEINGLIDGWRQSKRATEVSKAKIFDRRVADALITCLQGSSEQALLTLATIKADILEERKSVGRSDYMVAAASTMVALMLVFWLFTTNWFDRNLLPFYEEGYWRAATMGAIGAVFSISLQIRSRNVPIDLQFRDNLIDSALRVLIGATSGSILYALLAGRLVSFGFGGSGSNINIVENAYVGIVVPFIGGFAERLVGDFIGVATLAGARATNTLAGTEPSRSAPDAAGRDEKHLLAAPGTAAVADGSPKGPGTLDDSASSTSASEDDRDCCVAGQAITTNEMTDDTELPEALGGVQIKS